MTISGQLCLLCALVASGYAAFACIVGWQRRDSAMRRSGTIAALLSVAALSIVSVILIRALLVKDFRFAYVGQYCSRLLPWYYAISAFWVGQAGSLLLWAWLLAVVALAYRFWPRREADQLREPAFGVLMAYLCFLVAIMVFAADPMQPSIATLAEGDGLSPSLQHPVMLLHPPVVFLGYALWGVPFALAVAALVAGRVDSRWVREGRPWALWAWAVLGIGILLGAEWAYEELGWGGYWSWDPVENGSLIPWLTGTALIHVWMACQYRGVLKKSAFLLPVATFGLCNFATFLTRSGIFSSLHEFSQSPIGWMFLTLMVALGVASGLLVALRRAALVAERPISSLWSREALVLISALALVLLATVVLVGTTSVPLSGLFFGPKIAVGAPFYNNVLIPIAMLLLTTTAVASLARWGGPPSSPRKNMLLLAAGIGSVAPTFAFALGVRHPVALAVAWLTTSAVTAMAGALVLDVWQFAGNGFFAGLLQVLLGRRRQYAGFVIHTGFVCLAVGVAGSALGSRRHEATMSAGQTLQWAGRSIRCVRLLQHDLPDKIVMEAELEISGDGVPSYTLLPAQRLYRLQNEWAGQVAVHSTWSGDFYVILHGSRGENRADLSFVENPLMRWMWLGGWLAGIGTLIGSWPTRRRMRHATASILKLDERPKQRRLAAAALLFVTFTLGAGLRRAEGPAIRPALGSAQGLQQPGEIELRPNGPTDRRGCPRSGWPVGPETVNSCPPRSSGRCPGLGERGPFGADDSVQYFMRLNHLAPPENLAAHATVQDAAWHFTFR